jgi:ABC-type bacteriocin/lantibiotic exporter with double-glycine peptidase domain
VRTICATLGSVLITGCVSGYAGSARIAESSMLAEPGWRVVRDVPVILQESRRDCGAAALAAVLAHFGDAIDLSEIRDRCAGEPESGIRADALRDFARSRRYEAFCIPAGRDDLLAELLAGRPVLVGLVKPQLGPAVLHYEVVMGLAADFRVATIDPARGLTVNSWNGFFEEWSPAGRLALVIRPQDSRPGDSSR